MSKSSKKNYNPKRRHSAAALRRARAKIEDAGITIIDFAREAKVNQQVVKDILRGHLYGHRGQAHRAAVALGLKKEIKMPGFQSPAPPPQSAPGAQQ